MFCFFIVVEKNSVDLEMQRKSICSALASLGDYEPSRSLYSNLNETRNGGQKSALITHPSVFPHVSPWDYDAQISRTRRERSRRPVQHSPKNTTHHQPQSRYQHRYREYVKPSYPSPDYPRSHLYHHCPHHAHQNEGYNSGRYLTLDVKISVPQMNNMPTVNRQQYQNKLPIQTSISTPTTPSLPVNFGADGSQNDIIMQALQNNPSYARYVNFDFYNLLEKTKKTNEEVKKQQQQLPTFPSSFLDSQLPKLSLNNATQSLNNTQQTLQNSIVSKSLTTSSITDTDGLKVEFSLDPSTSISLRPFNIPSSTNSPPIPISDNSLNTLISDGLSPFTFATNNSVQNSTAFVNNNSDDFSSANLQNNKLNVPPLLVGIDNTSFSTDTSSSLPPMNSRKKKKLKIPGAADTTNTTISVGLNKNPTTLLGSTTSIIQNTNANENNVHNKEKKRKFRSREKISEEKVIQNSFIHSQFKWVNNN